MVAVGSKVLETEHIFQRKLALAALSSISPSK
jgi:hypothetical protein